MRHMCANCNEMQLHFRMFTVQFLWGNVNQIRSKQIKIWDEQMQGNMNSKSNLFPNSIRMTISNKKTRESATQSKCLEIAKCTRSALFLFTNRFLVRFPCLPIKSLMDSFCLCFDM